MSPNTVRRTSFFPKHRTFVFQPGIVLSFAMGGAVGGAVAATRCCQACDPDHDQESLDMDTSAEEFVARPWNDETLIKEGTTVVALHTCTCI